MKLKAAFVVILAVMGAVSDASESKAQDKAAYAALRENGAVALMRHADAPGAAGDPPGFNLNDCNTQRNLSRRASESRARADRKASQLALVPLHGYGQAAGDRQS
jgi:hypothetical protein